MLETYASHLKFGEFRISGSYRYLNIYHILSKSQDPVVQRVGNSIQWINRYPPKCIDWSTFYPLDSDLFARKKLSTLWTTATRTLPHDTAFLTILILFCFRISSSWPWQTLVLLPVRSLPPLASFSPFLDPCCCLETRWSLVSGLVWFVCSLVWRSTVFTEKQGRKNKITLPNDYPKLQDSDYLDIVLVNSL